MNLFPFILEYFMNISFSILRLNSLRELTELQQLA